MQCRGNIQINNNLITHNLQGGIVGIGYRYSHTPGYWPYYSSMTNLQITDNTIHSNRGDAIGLSSSSKVQGQLKNIEISHNTIYNNTGKAVRLSTGADMDSIIEDLTISFNNISQNQDTGIQLHVQGGAMPLGGIENVVLNHNTIAGNDGAGIQVTAGRGRICDLTISNNTLSSNSIRGISLTSQNTSEDTEYDTQINNNNITDNDQEGVVIDGNVTTQLIRNTIHHNRGGILFNQTQRNHATNNNIFDNEFFGVIVYDGAIVNAIHNYWGDTTGPHHVNLNPDGQGNLVNGDGEDLDFIPYLSEPY
jgi:parallel beta-helix repeat protein